MLGNHNQILKGLHGGGVILHIFLSNRGSKLAKLTKFVHGNKVEMLVYVET